MKKLIYILSLILLLGIITKSCKKIEDDPSNYVNPSELYESNQSNISVSQGIAGTIIVSQGNCMPTGPDVETTCRSYPVKRKIYIYEYTTREDTEGDDPFYTKINTNKVTVIESDKDGFFQVELDPGSYSLFAYEDNKYYANSYNGTGGICPVEITTSGVKIKNIIIDYAAY